jgi:hypothetical protein
VDSTGAYAGTVYVADHNDLGDPGVVLVIN